MTTANINAHCIAASILANEVKNRMLRFAPSDIAEIEVTVELGKIVQALRLKGVALKPDENGHRKTRRGKRR